METLTQFWLAALPGIIWSISRPERMATPYGINHVKCESDMLRFQFPEELPHPEQYLTSRLRIVINASVSVGVATAEAAASALVEASVFASNLNSRRRRLVGNAGRAMLAG